MTNTPTQTATAWHEAGHAIAALALGRPVHRVSIEPKLQRLGHCELKKGTFRPSSDIVETEILILLAGLVAEARLTGVYNLAGAAEDLRGVRAYTRFRGGSERQVEKLERRMLSKTEHLLEQPGMWLAIEQVAAELLRETTISGRAARHLFEQATKSARD